MALIQVFIMAEKKISEKDEKIEKNKNNEDALYTEKEELEVRKRLRDLGYL